jgi:integrase
MASVKLFIRKNKPLKTGECPIYLRITHQRKQKDIKVGYSHPSLWDDKNNLPSKKHPHYNELIVAINQKKLIAEKEILNLETGNESYTTDAVAKKINVSKVKQHSVYEFFEKKIDELEKQGRIGYANVFQATLNSLKKFTNKSEITFTEIDKNLILRFEECYIQKGVMPNTIFVYLRTLKTLLNQAFDEGYVKGGYDPFKGISLAKYRRIVTKKRYITKEDIKRIIEYKPEPDSNEFHARNYFLFSYYTRGLNFIDLAKLTWDNIYNDRLSYIRSKSKKSFNIELLPPALEILQYYKANYFQDDTLYIFPILFKRHDNPRSIDYRIDRMLKIVNKCLQKIADELGLNVKLTTYVSRHTFANVLKSSGASTLEISESLGHSNESTTQIYLDSFSNTHLDIISRRII